MQSGLPIRSNWSCTSALAGTSPRTPEMVSGALGRWGAGDHQYPTQEWSSGADGFRSEQFEEHAHLLRSLDNAWREIANRNCRIWIASRYKSFSQLDDSLAQDSLLFEECIIWDKTWEIVKNNKSPIFDRTELKTVWVLLIERNGYICFSEVRFKVICLKNLLSEDEDNCRETLSGFAMYINE